MWFGAIPTATELIQGEWPRHVYALERMCEGGDPFPGAARYRGAGPHPTVIFSTRGSTEVVGAKPPARGLPAATIIQLVACGHPAGRVTPDPLTVCTYSAGSGGNSRSTRVYQSRSRYEVLEARTGRRVSTITVDGSREVDECARSTFVKPGREVVEIDLEPTDAQLETAFDSLVDGAAAD